jgi:hypothetical protein
MVRNVHYIVYIFTYYLKIDVFYFLTDLITLLIILTLNVILLN